MTMLFSIIGGIWLLWAVVSAWQPAPKQVTSMAFSVVAHTEDDVQQLTEEIMAIQGVEDMQIFMDEQTAYLKVDKKQLDKAALQRIVPHVK
jgi:copper chaperone CopZ